MKKLLILLFLSIFMLGTFSVEAKRPRKKAKTSRKHVKVQCNNNNAKWKIHPNKRYKTSKRGGTRVGSFK